MKHWQVGDGREEALAAYVTSNAIPATSTTPSGSSTSSATGAVS